jgi:hypothetical protein
MGVEYIKDPIKPDVGPGFFEPVMIIQPLFGGIDADGVDVIQGFYEEFTIHDYDGNILITINDLEREIDFKRYNETDIFAFTVTKELTATGRQKHPGEKIKNIPIPFVFIPCAFDVDMIPLEHMLRIKNPEESRFQSQYTFTDKDNNYQLRYTFFRELENSDVENTIESHRKAFMVFVSHAYNYLTGDKPFTKFGLINRHLESPQNTDYGLYFLIENSESDLSNMYKYTRVTFYYKVNKGVLIQLYLINEYAIEPSFTPERLEILGSFIFRD